MYPLRNVPRESSSEPSVLIVGAGALGCPAAAALARGGVRRMTVIDPDRVEAANLPLQLLYDESDVGRLKAEAAAERLRADGVDAHAIVGRFAESNAERLVDAHDYVIDACDSPPTKLLINEAAVRARRPFCYAGVSRTGGLALSVDPGRTACLACVFGVRDVAGGGGGCSETGVLAPVAAVLGTLQALEALGALGMGEPWHPGRLAIYELRGRRWRFLDVPRDSRCAACAGKPSEASARRTEPCRS